MRYNYTGEFLNAQSIGDFLQTQTQVVLWEQCNTDVNKRPRVVTDCSLTWMGANEWVTLF